jgi:teichoic acid transport system ATP-binding protein
VSDTAVAAPPAAPNVVADHVDVTYRVYSDGSPMLRQLFTRDRSTREYRAVEAVKNITFVAHAGEAIGIIGHNGSGKSTLLRAIAGLVPVTGGEVYARSIPVLLGVGAALEPNISGRRNVFLGGTALGVKREELEEQLDDIVEFAGLEDFIDLPLRTYSSGMRSRLQFAIATAVTPEILMVDEALSTGDAEFKERSDVRIREMMAEAGTIFLVSHSLKSITDVCTRALWLDHGRLVADGKPAEVVAQYEDHIARRKATRKADVKAQAKAEAQAEARARAKAEQKAEQKAERKKMEKKAAQKARADGS